MAASTLHVLDIRTPPSKEYLRSAMQQETLARVTLAIRSGGGAIGSHWNLVLKQRLWVPLPSGPPGSAFEPNRETKNRSVVGGVAFDLAVRRTPIAGVPCISGWAAWHSGIATAVWDKVMATVEQNTTTLGSLAPVEEPQRPRSLPWLAVLRMPPSRDLSDGDWAELNELQPCIGWSAIEVYSE